MKFFKGLLLLTASLSSFAFARSGGGGGMATGGGAGVVCRDKNAAITSVQLLDLYETQVRDRHTLIPSTGNAKTDYFQAVLRGYAAQGAEPSLIPSLSRLQAHYYSFMSSIRWTSAAVRIPLLLDQGTSVHLPKNCALEQIALFHDENKLVPEYIEMDSLLWEKLSPLHQAALIWHEVTYKYYRILGDTNSELTRAQVASVFTAYKKIPVLDGVPQTGAMICTAVNVKGDKLSRFIIYPAPVAGDQKKWIWQFVQLMGRPTNEKTFAVLDHNIPALNDTLKAIGQGDDQMAFPTVKKEEAPIVQQALVQGTFGPQLELRFESQPGEPVKISVYQKNKLLGSNFLSRCSK